MNKLRKIDRDRPFGHVFGGGEAAFEQFGILFDANGDELPGFEEVEIPEHLPLVTAEGCYGGPAEIEDVKRLAASLHDELVRAREGLADAEARNEELQGQLDTANIAIDKLKKDIARMTEDCAGEEVASPPVGLPVVEKSSGRGKAKAAVADIDDQLGLQITGGEQ